MLVYLDSNIFILAALSDNTKAVKCKNLLKKMILGELHALTSSLTVDEIVWVIWKETKDRNLAIEEGLRILSFDNLKIAEVDEIIMKKSLIFMKNYSSLKPRDAIHLAVAIGSKCDLIMSDDSDFDKVKEIKRKGFD